MTALIVKKKSEFHSAYDSSLYIIFFFIVKVLFAVIQFRKIYHLQHGGFFCNKTSAN